MYPYFNLFIFIIAAIRRAAARECYPPVKMLALLLFLYLFGEQKLKESCPAFNIKGEWVIVTKWGGACTSISSCCCLSSIIKGGLSLKKHVGVSEHPVPEDGSCLGCFRLSRSWLLLLLLKIGM